MFSLILRISRPAKAMRPLVGRSMPVSRFSSVDLPLPDGPLMAKSACDGTVKVRSSRMVVVCAREVMTRER